MIDKETIGSFGLLIMGISFGGALSIGGHPLRVFLGFLLLAFIIYICYRFVEKKQRGKK